MLGVPVFGWVIALVLSASLCALQYFKLIRDSGGWKSGWIWAGACRFLAWFTLILLLFNPWWIRISQWVQDPVLLVYTDASKSISAKDQARWLTIKSTIEKTQGVKVQAYSASDAVVVQGQSQGLNPYHTNLSSVIQHVNQVATNLPVAGVVWFTDGINNEGRNPQFEPFAPGIPLVAVGAGDANPQIDASVEAVQCNDEAFLGNSFSVEISVRSQRLKSQPLKIQLKAGADIKEVLWVPSSDQDWKRIAFEIKPKVKGQLPLQVSVSGGKGDENRANNERVKYVKVVDERKKVSILYGAPHPDVAALKSALELGGQFIVQSLPMVKMEAEADVYILHGWKFQSQQELKKMAAWVATGKALWIFSTDAQNVAGLGKITGQSGELTSSRNWQEVQPHWNGNETSWGMDEKETSRWRDFPPVYAPVSKPSIPEGAEVLLYQRWSGVNTQLPLMVHWQKESAALAQFFGEGIWRWRMQERALQGDALAFDAWVRRSVGMLVSAAAVKKPLEILLLSRAFDLRDRIFARVVCRDKSGMVDENLDRQMTLVDDKGTSRRVNLSKEGQGWVANLVGLLPGQYQLKAQSGGGKFQAEALFTVVDQPAELLNTQANHGVLKRMADQTGGAFLTLKNGDSLASVLSKIIVAKPVMKSQTQNKHWWDMWGWMLLVVLLFGAEWSIRRFLGKY
ncbi:MAG: hypothetical protein FJ333_00310 [Sphingomonadales bacterium]|nr:hypothetical protein [Sphingomonadales bacterium]